MSPPSVIGPSTAEAGGTTNCACAAPIWRSSAANAQTRCRFTPPPLLAGVAGGLRDVPGSVIAQRLRGRGERPAARARAKPGERTRHRLEAAAGGDDLLRRNAVLDPVHHRREHVE